MSLKMCNYFGPPDILFSLSPEVSGTSGTMSIYIYIYTVCALIFAGCIFRGFCLLAIFAF